LRVFFGKINLSTRKVFARPAAFHNAAYALNVAAAIAACAAALGGEATAIALEMPY